MVTKIMQVKTAHLEESNKELDHGSIEHKWGGATYSTRLRLELYELHPIYVVPCSVVLVLNIAKYMANSSKTMH